MFDKTINDKKPKPVHDSDRNVSKSEGCLSYGFRYMLIVVLGVVLFYAGTGLSRWSNANNNTQREAEIHMNALIENGEELPVGEYVDLEVKTVLGPYATHTQSRQMSNYEISAVVKETGYYFVVLEDRTVMSVATANAKEKQALDSMSDQLVNLSQGIGDVEDIHALLLRGKLVEMSNKELQGFYEEHAYEFFGLTPDSPALRTIVLDTSAGRDGGYLIPSLIIAAVVFLVVSLIQKAKKKNASHRRGAERSEMLDESASMDGDSVIAQDCAADKTWHETQAQAGNIESMNILGEMYAWGRGVEQDAEKAKYWFKKARKAKLKEGIKKYGWIVVLIVLWIVTVSTE